jgi:hypothetical protein
MCQKITKTVASANSCSAMEAETIQKNGASLKSRMSRVNFLFLLLFFLGVFCITSCQKKQQNVSEGNGDNSTQVDDAVNSNSENEQLNVDDVVNSNSVNEQLNTDDIDITALMKKVLKWQESNSAGDFEVITENPDDEIYSGINWTAHEKRMKLLSSMKFFTKGFLDNYHKIALQIDKDLKENPEKYYVGEMPPFGGGANPWCNCQDTPEDVTDIQIVDLKVDENLATFKWKWNEWEDLYSVRAKKEGDIWKISYLEGFEIKKFKW